MIRPRPASVAPRLRLRLLASALGLAFLVVAGQLANLQILSGERLAALSDRNRLRLRPIAAPRGILFDRTGLPLVDNRPAFTLVVVPRDAPDLGAVVERLARSARGPRERAPGAAGARLVGLAVAGPAGARAHARRGRPHRGVAARSAGRDGRGRAAAGLPGRPLRGPPPRLRARGVGPGSRPEQPARRGDLVGQTGLERLHDEHLRGRDGGEQVEVDAYGRLIRVLDRQEPMPGAHMWTTIDRRIQQAAEDALGARAGAIVVMDPRNGDVLALASHPAYPVERFSRPLDRETWLALVQDPARPLLNRAVQGIYPPGSLFKIIVAAAGCRRRSSRRSTACRARGSGCSADARITTGKTTTGARSRSTRRCSSPATRSSTSSA